MDKCLEYFKESTYYTARWKEWSAKCYGFYEVDNTQEHITRPLQIDHSVFMVLEYGMHYQGVYGKLTAWKSLKNKSKLFYLKII